MLINKESRLFSDTNPANWKLHMLIGVAFLFSGFVVLLFPEILIVLIATLLFFIGVTIIWNAWHLRKLRPDVQQIIRMRWFS